MLSPVDIQNKQFKKTKIGGYSAVEVNDFLQEVFETHQNVVKENYELKDKINMLNENLHYYRTMEGTIQNALVLAEKTAQDTKALAYEKADQSKKEAEHKADHIIENSRQELYVLSNRIEELKKQYLSIKVQIKQMLQGQLEIIEQQSMPAIEEDEIEEIEQAEQNWQDEVISTDEIYYTKEFKLVEDEEV